MNKVSQKNICHTDVVKIHSDPPPIPLIKSNLYIKMERYYMKLKYLGSLRQKIGHVTIQRGFV